MICELGDGHLAMGPWRGRGGRDQWAKLLLLLLPLLPLLPLWPPGAPPPARRSAATVDDDGEAEHPGAEGR